MGKDRRERERERERERAEGRGRVWREEGAKEDEEVEWCLLPPRSHYYLSSLPSSETRIAQLKFPLPVPLPAAVPLSSLLSFSLTHSAHRLFPWRRGKGEEGRSLLQYFFTVSSSAPAPLILLSPFSVSRENRSHSSSSSFSPAPSPLLFVLKGGEGGVRKEERGRGRPCRKRPKRRNCLLHFGLQTWKEHGAENLCLLKCPPDTRPSPPLVWRCPCATTCSSPKAPRTSGCA